MTNKIKIIDRIMGAGKTTKAIEEMNSNSDKNYLYVGPLLNEVERIKTGCEAVKMKEPDLEHKTDGEETASKLENLKSLLRRGRNIATTHALFKMFDTEVIELVGDYTLVLDETIDCVSRVHELSDWDFEVLVKGEVLTVGDEGDAGDVDNGGIARRVNWNKMPDSRVFSRRLLKQLKGWCDTGYLYYTSGLVWIYPPEVFKAFSGVQILTYNFKGSTMDKYLEMNGFEVVIDKEDDQKKKSEIKKLCHVVDTPRYNRIGEEHTLSFGSYRKMDKATLEKIGIVVENMFRNYGNSISTNMWTCPKPQMKGVAATHRIGTLRFKRFNALDHKSPRGTFIYCGARATNDYRKKTTVAYLLNRFMDPLIKKYYSDFGFPIEKKNEEVFALNEMIQWIWRSAIREEKEITLFLPSSTMRTLFNNWLDSTTVDQTVVMD